MKKILLLLPLIFLLADGCNYGDLTSLQNENAKLQKQLDTANKLLDNKYALDTCLTTAQSNYSTLWNTNATYNSYSKMYVVTDDIRNWLETKLQNDKDSCFKQYPVTNNQ